MSEGDQFGAEPTKQKPRMGGGVKLLLGCGIGAGVLALLCCGVGAYFANLAAQSVSDDPVVVRQVSDTICTFDIPETMQPVFSVDMKIPFQEEQIKLVVYEIGEEKGMLALAQSPTSMAGPEDREEMSAEIEQNLRRQGRWQENVVPDRTEEIELTIRDKPAEFLLIHGKAEDSGVEAWEVSGAFEGKGGPAFLMLMVHADAMSKDEIVGLLKSIE